MALPLANLDDRRWIDLVEEARALIPFYAPQWTDHNLHDPGITFIELFAAIAEMDLYRLNRVPERHRRKFLALVGIEPHGPRPARTVVRFTLGAGSPPLALPAGLEIEGDDVFGAATRFRTLAATTVVAAELVALQRSDASGYHDLTAPWQRGESVALFGDDPRPGAALYLGFTAPLPPGVPVSLGVATLAPYAADAERCRLLEERAAEEDDCRPAPALVSCAPARPAGSPPDVTPRAPLETVHELPPHHSVRVVWQVLAGDNRWLTLEPARGEVEDATRSLTLNGTVRLTTPYGGASATIGAVAGALYYVRACFVAGVYDGAPVAADLALNAVAAEQAVYVAASSPRAAAPGGAVAPQPPPHDGVPGSTAAYLGTSDGRPLQRFQLPLAPAVVEGFELRTLEDERWQEWVLRPDFAAAGRRGRHYTLDASAGIVRFGDGDHGHVPSSGAPIVARYRATRAEAGALDRGTVTRISDTPCNRSALAGLAPATRLQVTNTLAASGGAAAETVAHAEGRAAERVTSPQRCVTLADFVAVARQTPGVRLARVEARANLLPALPCIAAPGVVTVLVLPYLPRSQPMPSAELLQRVGAYLRRRRILGTRVEVAGPTYVEIAVRAQVRAYGRSDRNEVAQRVVAALNDFFHPLTGGPGRSGWPFGRDVYRSEVLQVIDETAGVDHVVKLDLMIGGTAECGNACIGPLGLVAAGAHQIEVL